MDNILAFPRQSGPEIRSAGRHVSDLVHRPRRPAVQEVLKGLIDDARAVAAETPAGEMRALMGSFERRLLTLSSMFEGGDR